MEFSSNSAATREKAKKVLRSAALTVTCLTALVGSVRAEEVWSGLTWSGVTLSKFRLTAAAMGIDHVYFAEWIKSEVWSESHRRDYKTVSAVNQPEGTKLFCVTVGKGSQNTTFVLNTVTSTGWTSNFCRY